MRIDREYFIRFAVAVALACYDLPTDRAMTSEEAAQLVKWVIDMEMCDALSAMLGEIPISCDSIPA